MKSFKPGLTGPFRALAITVSLSLLLAACSSLPRAVRDDIASENGKLDQAQKQIKRAEATIHDSLAKSPDLFSGTPVATEWPARLNAAQTSLDRAAEDRRDLEKLHAGDRQTILKAERLLSDERRLEQAATSESAAIETEAARWLDFQRDVPRHLSKMQEEHDQLRTLDVSSVATLVAKAEQDWPAKKADLDSRLSALKSAPEKAEQQWQATAAVREAAAAGKASGPQLATLIQADSALAAVSAGEKRNSAELENLCGQLYDSWDKILEDLEGSNGERSAVYREKIKTVRTHFVDVAEKKTQTSSDVKWVDVSPAAYRAVENDLGMAISHKDAGLYDWEAQNTPQPAGYAYIAPPDVGRNQYGYWTHNEGGSFWTFLPEYFIMRELLWGRGGYQPIVLNEYHNYYNAQRAGRSWYGQESPQAPPKFGSHGTFTQQRYGTSRYVQYGGFKSSGYSSQPSAPAAPAQPRYGTAPGSSAAPGDSSQGRRFGHSAEDPPQGRRFGNNGGGAEPPQGRRFGNGGASPSAPRSAPRSFGRRR